MQSHIFTFGHRNAQGIAVGPDGTIYANEHGPSSDDELNVLVAGGNYGWPHVAGVADDSHYAYGNWSAASVDPSTLTFTQPERGFPKEVPFEKESEWAGLADMKAPLATMFTVGPDEEYDFSYFTRPTTAPSSIEFYASDAVPALSNQLLSTTLKHGAIYAFDPKATGDDAKFTRYYLGRTGCGILKSLTTARRSTSSPTLSAACSARPGKVSASWTILGPYWSTLPSSAPGASVWPAWAA